MLPHNVLILAKVMISLIAIVANGAPANLDLEDYQKMLDEEQSIDKDLPKNNTQIRCFCNQPDCVPQGYMCRGEACFTKLPSSANMLRLKMESVYSGCLAESLEIRQCPVGFLCCNQDLCNHVDDPAMKNRFNKTIQELFGDQRAYLDSLHPSNHGSQPTDGWFPMATIVVGICGFIVLLMIVSLGVRWLQPVPAQNVNKFMPHRTSDNGPPLLGSPKVPLV
ncbi:BMP and activin membrane-bound inhibitor homolog [Linepithema humile]|uniref:BMP and activin membrane-bound inhibitor homolog n=1 Tax=Linepithema humile TaxID=83485 RepID=UPI0006239ACC|nr:PREDICTED: BMP and activin membrane-bound inhibitor homolog [Linepithema humile]